MVECSPDHNADLFTATVGGMGLTGYIKEVRLKVSDVPAPAVKQTRAPFRSFEDLLGRMRTPHELQYASPFTLGRRVHGG